MTRREMRPGGRRAARAAARLRHLQAPADAAVRCEDADRPDLPSAQARSLLTRAECETAQLVAAGRSNREIAVRMVVSVRTVENRLQHVCGKLGVHSRHEMVDALKAYLWSEHSYY